MTSPSRPDWNPILARELRLQRRRQELGTGRACSRCGERRLSALLRGPNGMTWCYECVTGHRTELHHPRGKTADPEYIVEIPANDHRVIHDPDTGAEASFGAWLDLEREALLRALRR